MVKLSEKILFDVNVDMIEGDVETFGYCLDTTTETDVPENFHHMLYAVLANAKATEPDEIIPVNKGTRRSANHAERRKATEHKKLRMKRIEPFTQSVRRTRNGGVLKRGDTYSWLPEWEKADKRATRYSGKAECRDYIPDFYKKELARAEEDFYQYNYPDDYDPLVNPWGYKEGEEIYHGDYTDDDIQKIIAGWDDYDDDWGYDPYQEAISDREDAWDTISELTKEIESYKGFLNAFNLNTLFQHWISQHWKDNY